MAKVVGPLHSSEARGSVGSLTYNTWRGISTVKARTGPATQYTADQIALRALTANCTASWQSISDTSRSAWRDYATKHTDPHWTGNPQRITAYNWYVRINVRRQLLGQSIDTTPPSETCLVAPTNFRAVYDELAIIINWYPTASAPPATYFMELWLSGPHSPGLTPTIKQAKRLIATPYKNGSYIFTAGSTGTWTFFGRPIRINGVAGEFRSSRATWP